MAAGVKGPPPTGLPVEDAIADVRAALIGGSAVLQAEPGAGKTTVVPLRLLGEAWLGDGRIVVLEPRRVAARAAASRMAALLGERVGETVGLVTRDDRRVGKATRVEVVTEGVLTRRLQADPSLPGTALIVFDEFHERHLQGDLGLAFTMDVRDGLRPDLRVLVMSATLDAGPVAALLGGAPVVTSAGRTFPVEVRWAPVPTGTRLAPGVAAAVGQALGTDAGDVLVFLPGVGEIRAVADILATSDRFEVVPLHGGLPGAAQDRALRPGVRRRVVLATDLAETSVTVEGVSVVIDAGLVRRPYHDPASGLSRLRTAVASRASADQRAGRAGRLGPGVAYRMWSQAEHLRRRPWPDPEMIGADLAGPALELAVWGVAPGDLRWLDPPPPAAYSRAVELLEQLGALAGGRPTDLGRRVAGVPLHPAWRPCWSPPPSRPSGPPPGWAPCCPSVTSSAATAPRPPLTSPTAWPSWPVPAAIGPRWTGWPSPSWGGVPRNCSTGPADPPLTPAARKRGAPKPRRTLGLSSPPPTRIALPGHAAVLATGSVTAGAPAWPTTTRWPERNGWWPPT